MALTPLYSGASVSVIAWASTLLILMASSAPVARGSPNCDFTQASAARASATAPFFVVP